MKRLSLISLFLCSCINLFAQGDSSLTVKVLNSGGTLSRDYVQVIGASYSTWQFSASTYSSYFLTLAQGGKITKVKCKDLSKSFNIEPVTNSIQDYWDTRNLMSLPWLSNMNNLYSIRNGMEEEALSFINKFRSSGLVLDDPILESYIYSLISKMAPVRRFDGFPYCLNVVILQNEQINACIYPNGTLVINTGLLAEIHTEDELVSILAHEISHFISNHSLINIKEAIKRQERAEALGMLATAIAAATEGAMAANGHYFRGSLAFATAVLSTSIIADINERLGLNFSKEQETEADKMSVHALKLLGYDVNATSTVFSRISKYYFDEGDWASYYMSGDHPALSERIKCGTPYNRVDREFEKKVSTAVTSAAISKFNLGRFRQALRYVNQNIDNGVGTDDDYLIKATCLLNLSSTPESNLEALELVKKAKEINPDNVNILKCEIMASIRNGQMQEAARLITEYQYSINNLLEKLNRDSRLYNYWAEELFWTRRLLVKVNAM